jgi:hypothetical protein
LSVAAILVIDGQDVGNVDSLYVALFACGLVFIGDVAGELVFRACNLMRSASCADMFPTVDDDPSCSVRPLSVPAGGTEP